MDHLYRYVVLSPALSLCPQCFFVTDWALCLPCWWLCWTLFPTLGLPAVFGSCPPQLPAAEGDSWPLLFPDVQYMYAV